MISGLMIIQEYGQVTNIWSLGRETHHDPPDIAFSTGTIYEAWSHFESFGRYYFKTFTRPCKFISVVLTFLISAGEVG